VSRRRPATRIAMFLGMLAERQHEAGAGGRIDIPVRRTDIADYVSLSPVSVRRAFEELEASGIIRREAGGSVHIADARRFQALVADVTSGDPRRQMP
jgi:CRP-like cAMP-binding protein